MRHLGFPAGAINFFVASARASPCASATQNFIRAAGNTEVSHLRFFARFGKAVECGEFGVLGVCLEEEGWKRIIVDPLPQYESK